jgi:ferrous iron transport protein A
MKLSELKVGETACIASIGSFQNKSALVELGFLKGTKVQLKMIAPFGDPIAIEILGSIIAIRLAEADHITVEKVDE